MYPLYRYALHKVKLDIQYCRVVDPDPDSETLWIRIRIRIGNPDPDPGARKLRNFSAKNALFSYFLKKFYH
jgi:hypothetical protein